MGYPMKNEDSRVLVSVHANLVNVDQITPARIVQLVCGVFDRPEVLAVCSHGNADGVSHPP